jgi:AraC family transcriptional regulator, transcriptional activator of pobA
MNNQDTLTLTNPENGNLAFKIFTFECNNFFDHIQRNNYYSLIWIKQGAGKLKADFTEYSYSDNSLLAFSPYQPFMLMPENDLNGVAIQFHPDFFCIHKHQQEIACNGVLFNNIYEPPILAVDSKTTTTFQMIIQQMKAETRMVALAQYELLISYLKIFLINAARLKAEQKVNTKNAISNLQEPFILQSLKDAIEKNYKEKHTASNYADMLHITTRALAKITKTHLNKTLTSLISERIIIEAKRELYLTNKSVKQIAYELGYDDEYYFSRFFKINTDVSPQIYRNTVGFDRLSTLSVN